MTENFKLVPDSNGMYELQILKYPINNNRQKRKRTLFDVNPPKNKKIRGSFDNYIQKLRDSTEQCIDILINTYGENENSIRKGSNIYCPLHERKETSKTPSAKFNVKNNTYICFSTNCPIRKRKSDGKISSIDLLTLWRSNGSEWN